MGNVWALVVQGLGQLGLMLPKSGEPQWYRRMEQVRVPFCLSYTNFWLWLVGSVPLTLITVAGAALPVGALHR